MDGTCRHIHAWTPRAHAHIHTREKYGTYKILVRRPQEKIPLGGPRHSWVNNIKMNRKEIWTEDVVLIHLT